MLWWKPFNPPTSTALAELIAAGKSSSRSSTGGSRSSEVVDALRYVDEGQAQRQGRDHHGRAPSGLTAKAHPFGRIWPMQDEDGYFGERVAAATTRRRTDVRRRPSSSPPVDFLADARGGGRALELGDRDRADRAAARRARRPRPRHRPVAGDGRAPAAPSPAGRGSGSRSATSRPPRVDGTFRLAYLVFNTIMNLTTQAAQVACFRNVAAHLDPGGWFVIEVGVPGLRRLPPGERFVLFDASETHWGIDEYDVANQGLISHHFQIGGRPSRRRLGPVPLRVARRARPDGAARRHGAARALGGLGSASRSRARARSTSRSGRGHDRLARPRRLRSHPEGRAALPRRGHRPTRDRRRAGTRRPVGRCRWTTPPSCIATTPSTRSSPSSGSSRRRSSRVRTGRASPTSR